MIDRAAAQLSVEARAFWWRVSGVRVCGGVFWPKFRAAARARAPIRLYEAEYWLSSGNLRP
jgi:hypothetical protein